MSTQVTFLRRLRGELEGDAGDADDLVAGVAHGVDGFAGGAVPPARRAEVEAAEQFADEEDVGAFDDLGAQRAVDGELFEGEGRAQIGEAAERARICSRPASGRLSGARALNLLSPTAPSSTASESSAASSVAVGSGVPS